MSKKALAALVLLCGFMFLLPLFEYLYWEMGNSDLATFLVFQLVSISISFYILYRFKMFRGFKVERLDSEIFFQKGIVLYVLFAFSIFLIFYLKSVSSVGDALVFAEKYRNGFFKGSGIYTMGLTHITTLLLAFVLVKSVKLTNYFYFALLLLLIATSLLGLRIFLLNVLLFLVIRLLSNSNMFRITVILSLLFGFMVAYKLILTEGMVEHHISDIVARILSRSSYRYLVYDFNYGFSVNNFSCVLPILSIFSDCDISTLKETFVSDIRNISSNMPFISKYSGVALPLSIISYNIFGFLGIVFVSTCIVLFFLCLKFSYRSKSIFFTFVNIYVSFSIFGLLIEDINFIQKFNFGLFYVFICWGVVKFITISHPKISRGNRGSSQK